MRWFTIVALILSMFASVGCDADRKPMPTVTIVIMSEVDQFMVNQQRFNWAAMEAELKRIADENRRSMTGHVRAHVFVDAERGSDYYRTQDVVNLCSSMGFMNVISNSTGMK